ncbi:MULTISPECIES: hypothetical protein [Hymenobacter]|uniref:Uncharacterized protein n=2 Tax=Hymenobacter TaxID=89966 RepID=A0A246FG03_9BACT|nr:MULTISPECIES: hypothetical protein [Hymenobacter]NVO86751.1 hypothetical protein [Hymenobacter terrestris]OWP61470.1 hypothetical protein CDA63_19280 [Hymenobacter amundsenii]
MMQYILLASLLIGGVSPTLGQVVIQGDSTFLGLRIGKSSGEQVKAQLGNRYRSEKLIHVLTVSTRDGSHNTLKRETGVIMHYRKQGLICYINTISSQRRMGLIRIEFDATAKVSSAKGIQPGKHQFSDVIAQYGPVDVEGTDYALPTVREISRDGKQWYTVLAYPSISFVSLGKKEPGENLLARPVTGIWLGVWY